MRAGYCPGHAHLDQWPFGAGKTATANELNRRLPGSVVCDPAHVGFGMHRMLPPSLRGNFQDIPAWRTAVKELLSRTLRECDVPVIVPMTLVKPGYFQEIIGSLRDEGFDVQRDAERWRAVLTGPGAPNGLVAGLHYLVKDQHVSDPHAPVIAIQ